MTPSHYRFHATGMHCNSCVLFIEETLRDLPGVRSVRARLATREVEVEGDLGSNTEEVAAMLTRAVAPRGYALSVEKSSPESRRWHEFGIALPLAVLVVAGFIMLQRLDIIAPVGSGEIGVLAAFLVGAVASVSTCLAIVGGLVLSLAATEAEEGSSVRPQVLFHVGRLVGFVVLGALIGAIGSSFHLNQGFVTMLGIVVSLVMVGLGLNLVNVVKIPSWMSLTLPRFLGRRVVRGSSAAGWAPLILGAATFFLPCGFTQAMQLYSLSTGSATTAAFTMGAFALGTFPMLALLSFGSFGMREKSWSGIFFRTAGLVVLALAGFNLWGALAALGVAPPLL